ncbi:MAG: HD domain-containing protein [Sulfurovum sp.]|nr:HD domain-containing protein [Sulfurovum sp.]MDD3499694.1 HD domain-containing protein [Sulfurovum sp.]
MDSLKAEAEELLYSNAEDFKIAKVLQADIKHYLENLEESFRTSEGKDFLVQHTRKIDCILQLVYKVALRAMFGNYAPMKNSLPVAMIALGSYGREQLCVRSDIDLMIVYKEIPGYNTQAFIEKILYILWDTGLKLGHRVHTVEELFEVSRTDITIKTALIESRFIEGSNFIWTATQNVLQQIRHDNIEGFIQEKLQEQKEKHRKYPLTMEPNLKEGVGGFRDANLVFWIGKILYNVDSIKNLPGTIIPEHEYRAFRIALEFLFRVRSALHLVTQKKEDQLRLDLIPHVASLLGYGHSPTELMRFSRKVTESLKILRLFSTIWLELLTRAFQTNDTTGNYLYPEKGKDDIYALLELLAAHADRTFTAHPTLLRALVNAEKPERLNKKLYQSLGKLFYQPHVYPVLKTFSYARQLSYLLPPMKRVVDMPQFDGYHTYAVDIHSLQSVKHLENITEPFIQSLYQALNPDERAMLKLAALLHDAGKGRKKDHHSVGASLFKVFASRLGMKSGLIEMGETLILYHTLMSRVAQREDLHSHKVILRFASHFKSRKMLDLIYLLTYADMNAVGENVYNSFSSKLIHTLYLQALDMLEEEKLLDETAKRVRKEHSLKRSPYFLKLTKSQQNKILLIPSNLLFLRYTPRQIVEISKEAFDLKEYTFSLQNQEHLSIEIIRKTPINLGYLLAKLSNMEIRHMDIYKLFDDTKYFKIDFEEKVDPEELQAIEQIIHDSFVKKGSLLTKIPVIRPDEIEIDCEHSQNYGALYLNCQNQKGLLAYVTETFEALGIDILTAKIYTIKNRAKDMFLIEKNGNFCHNTGTIMKKLTGE